MAGGIGKEGEDYNVHKGELFTTDGAYKADFSGKFIPNYEKTLAKSKNNFNIFILLIIVSPALFPKTTRSSNEFAPNRFAP